MSTNDAIPEALFQSIPTEEIHFEAGMALYISSTPGLDKVIDRNVFKKIWVEGDIAHPTIKYCGRLTDILLEALKDA